MNRSTYRILLVGVGGQGVLTIAHVLGDSAIAAGLAATIGQLHGMSQRGGAVESSVVCGNAKTAHIGAGQADLLLGFEPLETLRALASISPATHVVMNRDRITPLAMTLAEQVYPSLESIEDQLRAACAQLTVVDASAMARQADDSRTVGAALLGVVARLDLLPFDETLLSDALKRNIPARALPANRRAFALGMDTHDAVPA